MSETEEKIGNEGGFPGKVARPIIIAQQENKTLSYPIPCQRCADTHYIQQYGPDAGQSFACGIMVENIEAGCMSFFCPYLRTMTRVEDKAICRTPERTCMCQPDDGNGTCGKVIAPVIDADEVQRMLTARDLEHLHDIQREDRGDRIRRDREAEEP